MKAFESLDSTKVLRDRFFYCIIRVELLLRISIAQRGFQLDLNFIIFNSFLHTLRIFLYLYGSTIDYLLKVLDSNQLEKIPSLIFYKNYLNQVLDENNETFRSSFYESIFISSMW